MTLFLLLTIGCIVLQGLFALFEMAAVSFNKVRLQYYADLGSLRFRFLQYLLEHPSRLFGTTLIGVNTFLQIGSECSRRFYESLHLDPSWAPLSQIILVVVFAELAPLFAARRHSEQIAMALAPLMMVMARIFSPLTIAFDFLSSMIHRWMGQSREMPLFLSREEVRLAFQHSEDAKDEKSLIIERIFRVKQIQVKELMVPLRQTKMMPSNASLRQICQELSTHYVPFIPLYHQQISNVVGIIHLRDLLRSDPRKKAVEIAKSPWFVTQETPILNILEQFKRNNQQIAVVLDASGQSFGLITFDQVLSQIFGEEEASGSTPGSPLLFYVERTVSGEMSLEEFSHRFFIRLEANSDDTLSDWIVHQLGHPPVKGEQLRYEGFIFTVKEASLRGVKSCSIRTV